MYNGISITLETSLTSCTPTRMPSLTIEKCNWVSYSISRAREHATSNAPFPKSKVFCPQIVLRMQSVPALVDIAHKHAPLRRSRDSLSVRITTKMLPFVSQLFVINPPISCPDSGRPSSQHRTHSIVSACLGQSSWLKISLGALACPSSSNPRHYPLHQHRLSTALYVRLPASEQPPRRPANPLLSRAMKWKDFGILLKWLQRQKVSWL
jgi:hypothetical protein